MLAEDQYTLAGFTPRAFNTDRSQTKDKSTDWHIRGNWRKATNTCTHTLQQLQRL